MKGSVPTSAPLPTEPLSPRSAPERFSRLGGPGLVSSVLRWSAVLLALAPGACVSAPSRVALSGDLPGLKAAISEADHERELGRARVKELAGSVLRRELSSLQAKDEVFPDVQPCVGRIRRVLEELASGSGAFAAPATLALIDAGFASPRAQPSGASGAGTALSARRAVGEAAGARRRAFMLHGDADVRRAALEAAVASADPGDIEALLEAARLDPDPRARATAVRALGRVGGQRAVLALSDLWATATVDERRNIILAWSTPQNFQAGGERQLVHVVEVTSGAPAVVAALELEQRNAGPPGLASFALARAIGGDEQESRLLAVYAAPWQDPALRAAINLALKHRDPATRVLAGLRLAQHGVLDAATRVELGKLGTDTLTSTGLVARAALARAGDPNVKAALRADLLARLADRRTLAALALVALDDWAGAAHALGDDSPEVRRAVACQMLADPDEPMPATYAGRDPARSSAFGQLSPELVPLLLTVTPG